MIFLEFTIAHFHLDVHEKNNTFLFYLNFHKKVKFGYQGFYTTLFSQIFWAELSRFIKKSTSGLY